MDEGEQREDQKWRDGIGEAGRRGDGKRGEVWGEGQCRYLVEWTVLELSGTK